MIQFDYYVSIGLNAPPRLTWNAKIGVDRRWFSSLLVPPQVLDGRHAPWICRQCAYQPDQKLTRLGQRQDLPRNFCGPKVLHKGFETAEALRISRLCPNEGISPLYSYSFGWDWNDQSRGLDSFRTMNCTKKMVTETEANHPVWSLPFEVVAPKEIGWLEYSKWSMLSHRWWFLKDFVGRLCTLVPVVAAFPYFD